MFVYGCATSRNLAEATAVEGVEPPPLIAVEHLSQAVITYGEVGRYVGRAEDLSSLFKISKVLYPLGYGLKPTP